MAVNPLIRQLGLKQLLQRESQAVPEFRTLDDPQLESALAAHVRQAWNRNKLAKEKIDRRMLNCLRARRGEYSAQALAQIQAGGGQNVVWADLTETKCRAGSAWIREIVLPSGEKPWGITPTPIPDLPEPIKRSVVNKAVQQAQQVMQKMAEQSGVVMERSEFRTTVAQIGEKLRQEAERELEKSAQRRAQRMQRQIADRLAQGGWEEALDAFVEDFVTFPAAILKGPIYRRHKRLSWEKDGFTPKVNDNPAQTWERVSPFDVYPSVGASDCQRGDFIERVRFWRTELHGLKGLPGYNDSEIERALLDYSEGHLEGWLWTESERQRLEKETTYLYLSPPGIIDAVNYWGSVPGWKLISWGVGDLEPDRDYEVNCLLIGRFVIYCALNPDPLGRRPYHRACYDEIPGAFWGRSIPDLAGTHQQMCNAIACSLADNLGVSSGPMGWVHMDRLADGEQSLEWAPWKMFQLKSDPTQGVNPGIGVFTVPDNSASLMRTYAEWETRADDATGVPRYTYGNGENIGAGDTATGLSMLLNNAAKGLRRAISNIDARVIQPTITMAFVNEMLYNDDESIKGDCVVVPRGAAAILIKESAQARRTQFLGMTANPIDMEIIGTKGRAALLREVASAMELPVDEVVPSEEALEEREQATAQQAQQQMQEAVAMREAEQGAQAALEQQKAEAKAAGDERVARTKLIGDVVKQAVAGATRNAMVPAQTPV
ncbi:MAG: hypothetical protein KF863_21450 [Rubrivivax sp.]|nr:hypothetical protein [Rubrivivax sp.]